MKIFGIIFVMLLLIIVVVAQEDLPLAQQEENLTSEELNETEEVAVEDQEVTIEEPETEAGTTPDSLLYGLDKAFEKISLVLTFDKAKKAEKRLKIASERIAELRVMIKKGKLEFTEKLAKEHDEEMEEVEKDIEEAKALGKNVTLLREHVAEMTYKHVIVLQEVLLKVPEQAKPAIEKVINKSIEGNERVVENIEKETGKPAKVPKVAKEKAEKPKEKEEVEINETGEEVNITQEANKT